MATRRTRTLIADDLPDLLTVDEAAEILRVGRTKAYGMAAQWRATGGADGLPVLDFGNVLRVPTHALEQLVGAPLRSTRVGTRTEAAPSEPAPTEHATPRRSRTQQPSSAQLDLFDPAPEP